MDIEELKTTPTMTVTKAAELLGISRDSAYAAVKAGEIPSLRLGRRILVPTAKVFAMLGMADPHGLPLYGPRDLPGAVFEEDSSTAR